MNRLRIFLLAIIGLSSLTLSGQDDSSIRKLERIDSLIKTKMEVGATEELSTLYFDRASTKIGISTEIGDALYDLQTSATYARYNEDTLAFHKASVAIAELYTKQEIYYNDAISNLENAIEYYNDKDEMEFEAKAYTLLSQVYDKKQDYELALLNIEKALKLNVTLQDTILQLECNIIVSNLLALSGNIEKAINISENNLKLSQLLKQDFFIAENLLNLAFYNNLLGDFKRGSAYLDEDVILRSGNSDQKSRMYELLSDYSYVTSDINSSFIYFKEHIRYKDSLAQVERRNLTNSMTYEFRMRDKEREINRLEKDREITALKIDQQNRLVKTLIAGLVGGLLALFFIIRFYVQKIKANQLLAEKQQQLDQQKIKDLENDFKIKNLESMVVGQEEERKRISTDLHDSLGGMLSALKLQYDSLQLDHENLVGDGEYEQINSLIDTACDEVRNIARNLKPAALEKIGLKAALTDLVNRYKKYPNSDITLHFHKTDKKLDYNTKVHIYRILQELINNAIKHSKCSELDIQISSLNNEFVVMVEDNGVGFDQENAVYGHGIDNIRSRVNILKGELHIDSQKNRGTSIIIHIPQYAEAI